MVCRKCKSELPLNAAFCPVCGVKQRADGEIGRKYKQRGNGQGTVVKRGNGYRCEKSRSTVTRIVTNFGHKNSPRQHHADGGITMKKIFARSLLFRHFRQTCDTGQQGQQTSQNGGAADQQPVDVCDGHARADRSDCRLRDGFQRADARRLPPQFSFAHDFYFLSAFRLNVFPEQ